MYDIFFENALVVDGSGKEAYRANVATLASSIALIGKERVRGRVHVDATDLVLCPGFVDIHAHSELAALKDGGMDMKLAQGITTDLSGNCGIGVFPLDENRDQVAYLAEDVLGTYESPWDWDSLPAFASRLKERGLGINMGFLQAHSPLRIAAMGRDTNRAATDSEIEKMCTLLDESLAQGAFGFSTGLYYQPCTSADGRELAAILKVVAKHDALFAVHMRSEGDDIIQALEEVLSLSLEADCRLEISHLKIIGGRNQWKLDEMMALIHSYRDKGLRVAYDQYPYPYGSTSLFSLLPPWALALSRMELRFALQLEDQRSAMRRDILQPEGWESVYSLVGPENIRILHLDGHRELEGKLLAELDGDPLESLFDVLSDESGLALMCDVTEKDDTFHRILTDDLMSFSTDALYSSFPPHVRSHSAALELIRKYVLDGKLLTLEECIRRMTSANIHRMGLSGRGSIREGAAADLVLFDPKRLDPDADWKSDRGLEMVVVGGRIAAQKGRCTGERAGQILVH